MPVKGLYPDLLQMGYIKIGGKGEMRTSGGGKQFRLPVKYDHFEITTMERDNNDNFLTNTKLTKQITENGGIVNKQGKLVGIPVRLLYNDIDMNFPTRYAFYEGNMCKCSGDGEFAKTNNGQEKECPCHLLDERKCKINGTLTVLLDGSDYIGSCFKFRTTSFNTCRSVLGSLAILSSITAGTLAFLPLMMVIQPKNVTAKDGKNYKIQIVSIVYRGTVDSLQQKVIGLHRDNAYFQKNIEMAEEYARYSIREEMLLPDVEKDIAEEFYPPETEDGLSDQSDLPPDINPEQFAKYIQETLEKGNGLGITEKDIMDTAKTDGFQKFKEWAATDDITVGGTTEADDKNKDKAAMEAAADEEGELEF